VAFNKHHVPQALISGKSGITMNAVEGGGPCTFSSGAVVFSKLFGRTKITNIPNFLTAAAVLDDNLT